MLEADVLGRMTPPGSEVQTLALFRLFARNRATAEAMTGWAAYELSRGLSLPAADERS